MVIFLAYMHRYGWIAAMVICIALWPEYIFHILCASCLLVSAWSLVGYKRRWRHIYCSYQNAGHQKMTPRVIVWSKISKSEAYGAPLVFLVVGLVMLLVILFGWL